MAGFGIERFEPYYVVSGCSGSGKSTLLDALARRGEAVVPEPGRRVVQQELACGGDALPWANAQRFVERCVETARRDLESAVPGRRTFFDRSLVDAACAVARAGLAAPPGLDDALRNAPYARLVFLSPPWRDLFATDRERRHGFDDAVAEHDALGPACRGAGFEGVRLPQAPVEARVDFVLATVDAWARRPRGAHRAR